MKKYYLLYLLLITCSCFAQFSKTHYIPPLSSSNASSAIAQKQYLYISTPNVNPVNFKIREIGGNVINATVSKSAPYVHYVGIGDDTQLVVPEGQVSSILNNKGYIIEAEDLVYVSARVLAAIPVNNQSGALVSKGLAALGTQFRIGAFLNTNTTASTYTDNHYTFVSVLATENNTLVQFEDIKPGVRLLNNVAAGNMPAFITLNAGESFVMATVGPWAANKDALVGSVVISDKPIAVNCGSFCGSNAVSNLDTGFDQIVSAERTGKDYIFIKSTGQAAVERVLLIANENNTQIFLSGTTGTPDYTINAGDYIALDGNDYTSQGNLYVHTNKNVFAYQSIGDNGRPDAANQELFFVPPLSCETPHVIDNIPLITQIGTRTYSSKITLVTGVGSTVDVEVDGVSYPIAALGFLPGVTVTGPTSVVGNLDYETYIVTGLSGNIGAFSTSPLYMAAYGNDDAATYGGFYSGFTFKPEIAFNLVDVTQNNCLPNTELTVNSLSPFDIFQWFFNGNPISGATGNTYTPTLPGYYHVQATIANCGTTLVSDDIPISSCPNDFDNDLVNDNIDLDNDNDGLQDCTESLGNQPIDLSDASILNVTTSGAATPSPVPFAGTTTGDFVTEAAIGKNNTVSFRKDFAQPTSVMLDYVITASNSDLLNDSGEFVLNCDVSKTITVVNPSNQLLIDTNFDGIYESGITQFSSFEIRFRLNSATPLAAGLGTFRFRSSLTTSIAFTHRNLSDTAANRATFRLIATCVPIDSDGDGITNNFDSDSDNDGIPDVIESHGATPLTVTNTDANSDGLYDVFGTGINPVDTDNDGVPDYIDLDSDNDGIYDLVESGSNAPDANGNGMVDGVPSDFGANGLSDTVETAPDSGTITYSLIDSDADATNNYLETDSDGDGCLDTVEAGYTDANNDGLLGDGPVTTNSSGVVTNAPGYAALPNQNYTIYAPIAIVTQPVVAPVCDTYNTSATVVSSPVDFYQWQVFTVGASAWASINNNATYSGVNSDVLQINNANPSMDGWKYRVVLQKTGNSCGLISDETTLAVHELPVITSPVTLIDCDEDTIPDGVTDINLRQKEDFISSDPTQMTFTYYKSQSVAELGDTTSPDYISNPIQYNTGDTTVWVRVENSDGCFKVARLMIRVGATRIPSAFHLNYYQCDDFLDTNGNNNANNDNRDGIAYFDFGSATASITALLPTSSTFTIKYYKNVSDANAVTDDAGNSLEISQNAADPVNIHHYRNIEYPNQQSIWVRVQSSLSNDCFGLGSYITLNVEALPFVNPVDPDNVIHHCDDDQDGTYGFDTSGIDAAILDGQTNVSLSYFDASGTPLPSPLPNPFFVTGNATITVKANNTITFAPDGPCNIEGHFDFIVDDLPEALPINAALLTTCDDEANPLLQDGRYAFDTSTFESTILGGQTGMVIKYTDAAGNPLPQPLPNPFVTGTQNVTVTVQNPLNADCIATQALPFTVHPLPKIDLNTDGHDKGLICTNLPALTVTIGAGVAIGTPLTDYTYQWFLEGTALPGETSPTLTTANGGTYTVEVTTIDGCQRKRTVEVYISEIATIRDIKITDLADVNTIQVVALGTGDYVYSLDYDAGYQDSSYFPDVSGGTHQVYVKDLNGCGTVGPIEIYVLSVPKYFTPNGDGFHDTWNIKGVTEDYERNTTIYIFDRFGKLVKQLNPLGEGWDGTFNGDPLPADDYWYSIEFEDKRIVKGHFSLKR